MFGKSNWSVARIKSSSREAFEATLNSPETMFAFSQFAAAMQTRSGIGDFNGINPFVYPRRDEGEDITESEMGDIFELIKNSLSDSKLWLEALIDKGLIQVAGRYGHPSQFSLYGDVPVYGLWFVTNEWKDIQDAASKKERIAYDTLSKPFKLANSKQKQSITNEVEANAAMVRKQFPVIIDFVKGFIYINNVNKNVVFACISTLGEMGVDVVPSAWNFGDDSNWPSKFLQGTYDNTSFSEEFQRHAEIAKSVNKEELAEGETEDPMMTRLIASSFASRQLEDETWVSLGGPASIRIASASFSIGVSDVVNATLLLKQPETSLASANVVLQDVHSNVNKKTEKEHVFRTDLGAMVINQEMNLVEVGVALMRGFDVPSFKKQMKSDRSPKEIKAYWSQWAVAMHHTYLLLSEAIADTLALPREVSKGIHPISSEETSESVNFSRVSKEGDTTVIEVSLD